MNGQPAEKPARGIQAPALALRVALLTAAVAAGADAAPARPIAPALSTMRTAEPRQTVNPLEKARFRRPDGDLMALLYSVLRKQPGLEEMQIATVPTSYVHSGGTIFSVGAQFATFYGDVDGDKQGEWVVGCYVPVEEPSTARPLSQDERARIAVLDKDADGNWKAWVSPGLGYEFAEPTCNVEEVSNGLDDLRNLLLPLSLVDVDGDGRLEIAYHGRSRSAAVGGLPGIYRWDTRRWVSVAPQADRFSLQDLDGDKKLELITGSRRIGHGAGDDDVPRVWRWRTTQFREASSDFPRFYADLTLRYTEFVRRKEQAGEDFDRSAWQKAIQRATVLSGRPAAGRSRSGSRPTRFPS